MKKVQYAAITICGILLIICCVFFACQSWNLGRRYQTLETEASALRDDNSKLQQDKSKLDTELTDSAAQLEEKERYVAGQKEYISELSGQIESLTEDSEDDGGSQTTNDNSSADNDADDSAGSGNNTYTNPDSDAYPNLYAEGCSPEDIKKVVYLTFDDGPCRLPACPDRFRGKPLTLVLAETLERYGARGTFDVVGDTSANYPDRAGKHGSASWGGVAYDHYPDFQKDDQGGVTHCPELVSRLLAGGHEITSHTYAHVLFGWKPLVYGRRKYLQGLDPVVADLKKLHHALEKGWGYSMRLGRPPHYVDGIKGGFTSYDAYALMGYQYMAASFDGAGWLPLASYEAEVEATWRPMERLLLEDPDAFRGQIIFQKDGYNMAKRTPVAFGLRKQLELLKEYGYQVVTVAELMEESPFADLDRGDPLFDKLCRLQKSRAVAYSDNRVRLDQVMTWGELAMLMAPKKEAMNLRWAQIRSTGRRQDAYCGALEWCMDQGLLPRGIKSGGAVTALPGGLFGPVEGFTRRDVYGAYRE